MPHNTTNTTNNHRQKEPSLENQKVFGAQNSSVSPHGPVQPEVLKRIFSLLCFFCCSPYLTQHKAHSHFTARPFSPHVFLFLSLPPPFVRGTPPTPFFKTEHKCPILHEGFSSTARQNKLLSPLSRQGFLLTSCSTPTIITLNVQSWQSSPLQFTKKVKPHVHSFISPRAPSSTRFPHTLPFTILILPSKGLS